MQTHHRPRAPSAALLAAAAAATCATLLDEQAAAQSFTPIPPLPGATSMAATAISADATVVIGIAETPAGSRAFRWSASQGTVQLPMLPGWNAATAAAISSDGSIIVGSAATASAIRPVRWSTRPGEPPAEDLGLPAGAANGWAYGVSGDGSIIAGYRDPGNGFRWTAPVGFEHLPSLGALAISRDGNVVVGITAAGGGYWTSATGTVSLQGPPLLPNVDIFATAANADGSVIVGISSFFGSVSPVRWDVDIAAGQNTWEWLADNQEGGPGAVSDNGAIIAGWIAARSGSRAVLWHHPTSHSYMIDIAHSLASSGVNLAGWQLTGASALSAGGHTVAGTGYLAGAQHAWIATMPPRAFCYANCDNSTVPPVLNVDDFTCFINEFAHALTLPNAQQHTHYANCDASIGVQPVLSVDDFTCFINAFAQGCP